MAGEVIARKGLDRTSLEDIAERAGMTRGAIYGNFRDKEELFLAVAATRWTPILPPPGTTASLRERMRAYGVAVATAAIARRSEAVGATSFVQYVLTHNALRKRVVEANRALYESAAIQLTTHLPPAERPLNPAHFVKAVHALTEGMVMLHAIAPELMTHDTIVAAFEALAGPTR